MGVVSIAVPLAEAKSKLSELVDRVSCGEEFNITRHNAEIARLIPAHRSSREDVDEAIRRTRAGRSARTASVAEIQEWKAEGRR